MRDFVDKTSTINGTPINRDYLMALQGFDAITTTFPNEATIIETNSLGETLTTTFDDNGNIVETFVGEKTIIKTTTFKSNGDIIEVIS